MLGKDFLSKKIAPEYDLSCTIRKDGISFSQKYDYFSRRKMKDFLPRKNNFSQKIHGNMTNISGTAKKGDAHPRKDVIGTLD